MTFPSKHRPRNPNILDDTSINNNHRMNAIDY